MRRLWLSLMVGLALALPVAPLSLSLVLPPQVNTASAAPAPAPAPACDPSKRPCFDESLKSKCPDGSNGVKIALPFTGTNKCVSNDEASGGAIVNYLKTILRFFSGAIGVIVILMLIVGGIEYITSIGDAGRIKHAKGTIQNALIALFLFLMMFAFLTFLIPGGIL